MTKTKSKTAKTRPSATAGERVFIEDNLLRAMETPSVIPMLDLFNWMLLSPEDREAYVASLDVLTRKQWAGIVEAQLKAFGEGRLSPPEGHMEMLRGRPAGPPDGRLVLEDAHG